MITDSMVIGLKEMGEWHLEDYGLEVDSDYLFLLYTNGKENRRVKMDAKKLFLNTKVQEDYEEILSQLKNDR